MKGVFLIIKLFLYKLYNFSKYLRMSYSHIRENFSVESNTFSIHRVDECRIVHTIETSCVIETNCPELTKLSLLEFSRNICILSCLHDSILSTRVHITIHTSESFCKGKDIFMSFVCHHTTFYTSHKREIRYWVILRDYLPYGRERRASSWLVTWRTCPYASRPFALLLLSFRRCLLAVFATIYLPVQLIFTRFFAPEWVLSFMGDNDYYYFFG